MKHILVMYYTQSGEAGRVVDALEAALRASDATVVTERLRPKVDYPFPWRSIGRFFDVLPECHLGPFPELQALGCDPEKHPDLVILVYQVWFLMPSLPVQSFLHSPAAQLLRDTNVITIVVSRSMWYSASLVMKALLREAGARHVANLAVTHQGPAWATFIRTPWRLLFGKGQESGRVADADLIRTAEVARSMSSRSEIPTGASKPEAAGSSISKSVTHTALQSRYLIPDFLGWHIFRGWAYFLRFLGSLGAAPRRAGIYLFIAWLVFAVLVLIPLTMILRLVFYPILKPWLLAYARRCRC